MSVMLLSLGTYERNILVEVTLLPGGAVEYLNQLEMMPTSGHSMVFIAQLCIIVP